MAASTVLPLPQFVLRRQGLHRHGFSAPSAEVNIGKEADNGSVSLRKCLDLMAHALRTADI